MERVSEDDNLKALHDITCRVLDAVKRYHEEHLGNRVAFRVEYTIVPHLEDDEYMHSIECLPEGDVEGKPTIVMCPGYAAHALLFANNMPFIAKETGCRVIAVDWLGTGLSSRPVWHPKDPEEGVGFFLDAFEHWRTKLDLENIILIAHSMGGFLAMNYALRIEQRIQEGDEEAVRILNRLILASPVGIPSKPENAYANVSLSLRGAYILWRLRFTPQGFIRALPRQLAYQVSRRFTRNRFGDHTLGLIGLDREDPELLYQYFFRIVYHRQNNGSGEHAIHGILEPGSWARLPLAPRLKDLTRFPMLFVYGTDDWMFRKQWSLLPEDFLSTLSVEARLTLVENGTHHVYLRTYEGFNAAAIEFAKEGM